MEKGTLYLLEEHSDFCMSFVICSPEGEIIVIDGGHTEDADYLSAFLGDRPVNTWIVTHAHPDHICAVNRILADGTRKIGRFLYHFPPTDFVYAHEPLYAPHQEEFIRLAEASGAQILHPVRGDCITCGSLKIHILMTTDPSYRSPVLNNHSLVFRIDSPRHRALFPGDLEPDGGDRLTEITAAHPDELRADIVQAAHHGHMSVARSVYERIRPEIALWCAPLWLYEEPETMIHPRMYGTKMTRKWLDEMGVRENHASGEGTCGICFD